MTASDYDYDDDFQDDADELDDMFDCGAWTNGTFDYWSCRLAGTEDCDWECPYADEGRAARIEAMKRR